MGVESELKTVSVLDTSGGEIQGEKGRGCERKMEEKRIHKDISFFTCKTLL